MYFFLPRKAISCFVSFFPVNEKQERATEQLLPVIPVELWTKNWWAGQPHTTDVLGMLSAFSWKHLAPVVHGLEILWSVDWYYAQVFFLFLCFCYFWRVLVWQEIQNLDPGTVVWELKQQLFERRDGYPPANSRHADLFNDSYGFSDNFGTGMWKSDDIVGVWYAVSSQNIQVNPLPT